jgi:hypothetical protein
MRVNGKDADPAGEMPAGVESVQCSVFSTQPVSSGMTDYCTLVTDHFNLEPRPFSAKFPSI